MRALPNIESLGGCLLSFSSSASLSNSAATGGSRCATPGTDASLLPTASGANAIHTVGAAGAILLYLLPIAATPKCRRGRIATWSCVLRLTPPIHPRRLFGAVLESFVSAGLISIDIVPIDIVSVDVVAIDIVPVEVIAIDIVSIDVVPIDIVPVDVVARDVVSPHCRGAIQVRTVATNVSGGDIPINVDVGIAVVDVYVAIHVHIDERAINADPAAANPTVVIDTSAVPVPIVIEPRADRQSGAKGNCRRCNDRARRWPVVDIHNLGVVLRNVNHLRLPRDNPDDFAFDDHLLLRSRNQTAGRSCFGT